MCGLIACSGKIESRYITALGCLAESRGDESAGVGWSVGGAVRIAKVAQNPLVAFPVTLAPAIRHASKYGSCLIGHTRQATTGAVCNTNAHPFYDKETGIAWAHNGMIYNHEKFGEYQVDSESLIHGITKRDFSDYHGPIALVWIESGKLHAFRKGNPLFRGIRHKGIYLASEESMLAAIGCKRIKELGEGLVYSWTDITLDAPKRVPYNRSYSAARPLAVYDGEWDNWHRADYKWKGKVWDGKNHDLVGSSEPVHKCHPCAVPATDTEELNQDIKDAETLCFQCQENPKMTDAEYCTSCYYTTGHFTGE